MQPTFSDRPYGPHASNRFDAYLVESDEPTPAFVHIHGGGFQWGDKANVRPDLIDAYHSYGISVIAINYRLSQEAPAPAAMHDAARAIQAVRYFARHLNIDLACIAAGGGSAGAGISLWLALHPDLADPESLDRISCQSMRVNAAVVDDAQSSYDPTFIRQLIVGPTWTEGALRQFYRYDPDVPPSDELRALFADLSPINFVSADAPPIFMWYWTRDLPLDENLSARNGIHHPEFGRALKAKMDAAGARCDLHYREELDDLTNDEYVAARDAEGARFVAEVFGRA
jgi:acetyl esterase/lipase